MVELKDLQSWRRRGDTRHAAENIKPDNITPFSLLFVDNAIELGAYRSRE